MHIDLLGSLRVSAGGMPKTPSAPKLRQVLALLALNADRVVRTEQIIEELWEEHPPVSVMTTLQTYVYQLRKLLGARPGPDGAGAGAGGSVLVTSSHGYLLALPAEKFDFRRFEKLAAHGRLLLEAGQAAEAARTLADALALWRGPALVDIAAGPVLRPETLRLTELRTNAVQWRIDAELALGRHEDLLGELTGLAVQNPTHEGFQARLMLALHRAGRRSEALRVYQRARTALAEQLGLDPSAELRNMHRSVLAGDDGLTPATTPRAVAVPAPADAPCHLPPKGQALVGRETELAEVLRALKANQGRPAVVVVNGPPASGKSALCVQAAYLLREHYPDGRLYCNMLDDGRPAEHGEILGVLLRALGVHSSLIPESASDRCLLLRSWTAQRRVLLVLDDVVDANRLSTVLPSGDRCGVLVVSRRRLSAPGATAYVELDPLDEAGAIRLLTDGLGKHRLAGETEACQELVRLCDGLPGALQAAVAKLRLRPHWKVERLVEWVRQEAHRARATDPLGVQDSLERSYLPLEPEARTACARLAGSGVAVLTPATAAVLLGTDAREAEAVLEDLVEARLMTSTFLGDGGDEGLYQWLPSLALCRKTLIELHARSVFPRQATGEHPAQLATR